MKTSTGKGRRVRKWLNIPEEEFFERVLFLLGPPTDEFRKHESRYSLGISEWLKLDENGRKFRTLLEAHGEARTRGPKFYLRYSKWYHNQGRKP